MSGREVFGRIRAVFGLALAQLRRSPGRATLTVIAVALAVLSVTLLASLGVGVVDKGEEGLESADRDIWISSDPVDPTASGTQNPIVGAHGIAAEIHERDDVRSATPIAVNDVYIGSEPDELQRHSAVGVESTHSGYDFVEGEGFSMDDDPHERPPADEPQTAEIVLDPRIADELDIEPGETVYVGTSRETAAATEFTVVGTSRHHSQYLGSPAATVPFADLQAIAGTSGTDRATFLTVDVADDADREAVADDLAAEYPAYDVRTSDQQVQAMLEERPLVLASGATLVGLAVLGGVVLTVNLFALVAYQQREELAALRAIGLSRWVLAGTIGAQGLVIGLLGGLLGVAATPLVTRGLNYLAADVIGFERLLRTPLEVYVVGLVLAVCVGTVVAIATGWRTGRYATLEHLDG
ncbi:ABC transporter permease [Natronococcus pandeyae]|uniref:ABC transporter permease n=1 Tax=Natronococcus pandeyae TaxID=2055836 RepID=A0A8J8PZU4_9EURY|nr:ABC transporter permease [Natronococcus pandeyae]TYL36692.1 ABC transporter permease [Natronococcus pandeyae]